MPYEDELPPGAKTPQLSPMLERLAREAIGIAIEVHRHLGPGLPEEAYHAAMRLELIERKIPFESQKIVDVIYKGRVVARAKIDLLIGGILVVELKSIDSIGPLQRLQVRTYIRLVKQPLGLLINFNVPVLKEGIRRIIESNLSE